MAVMNNTTNVVITMNSDTKKLAEILFAEMGMSMSTAFNIFVRQAIRDRKIPFTISLGEDFNDETQSAMIEAKYISKDPYRIGYDVDDAIRELKADV